jgi:hypothetical protein
MKKVQSLCCVGVLLAMALPALGQDVENTDKPGLAASVRLGTLGYGAELDYPFNSYWNARVQINSFNYDDDFNESNIEYSGELDLSTFGALVDFRPFEGTFKLTAGFFSNKNSISADATSANDKVFEIGGQRFSGSASNPLSLSANVDLGKSTAGYLGLGWGNSYSTGLTFNFELGALLSGSATANLTARGTAYSVTQPQLQFDVEGNSASAVQFRQELAKEQASLQQDLDDFEVYPVVALGLGYRF